jgi:hypothetical protein
MKTTYDASDVGHAVIDGDTYVTRLVAILRVEILAEEGL